MRGSVADNGSATMHNIMLAWANVMGLRNDDLKQDG